MVLRLEAPHLPLPLSGWLMGQLRAIVSVLAGVMARCEAMVDPNCVADDLRREPVSIVSGLALIHPEGLPNATAM